MITELTTTQATTAATAMADDPTAATPSHYKQNLEKQNTNKSKRSSDLDQRTDLVTNLGNSKSSHPFHGRRIRGARSVHRQAFQHNQVMMIMPPRNHRRHQHPQRVGLLLYFQH